MEAELQPVDDKIKIIVRDGGNQNWTSMRADVFVCICVPAAVCVHFMFPPGSSCER